MGINFNKYFLLLLIFVFVAASQTKVNFSQKAENDFEKGLALFASHKYEEAKNIFSRLSTEINLHQRSSISILMHARSLEMLKQFQTSNNLLAGFLKQYPKSNLKIDALETMGANYFGLNNFTKSISVFLEVLVKQDTDELKKVVAQNYIKEIILHQLPNKDLNTYLESFDNRNLGEAEVYLLMQICERLYKEEKTDDCKKYIYLLQNNTEDKLLISQSDGLLRHLNKKQFVEVGVLLPLFEKTDSLFIQKNIGLQVKKGMEDAVQFHNQNSQTKIKLTIYDIENNIRNAANMLHEFSQYTNCIGVIGPLFSNEAQVLASFAQRRKIPLITPTATDTGISSKGNFIFQLNVENKVRGKMLAQFVTKHLNKKNVAIISPSSYPQRFTSDVFSKEILESGGLIVSDIRYPKGATDLRNSFRMIRSDGMMLEADTSYMKKKKSFYVDSLQYPVNSIDILYAPITSADQISILTSHIKLYNISTTILGSNEWFDRNELELNKNNISKIFIPTEYNTDNMNENINYIYGFDAISIISNLIEDGARTRDCLANELNNLLLVEGVKGKYSLFNNRSNSAINFLEYSYGTIKKVDEVNFLE